FASSAETVFDYQARDMLGGTYSTDQDYSHQGLGSYSGQLMALLLLAALLFMLLPTINLVNINISRIIERASEIGVRKSFGASSGKLVMQFVFENIILTLLGGIIGVIISLIAITFINHSDLIPNIELSMNF